MRYLIKILILILGTNTTWGQLAVQPNVSQSSCGFIVTEEYIQYLDETREQREQFDINLHRISRNIPLVAHIIRRTNGTGGLSMPDLELSINQLNDAFDRADLFYDLCDINFIDDTAIFNDVIDVVDAAGNVLGEDIPIANPEVIDGAVNVFFFPNIQNGIRGWVYNLGSGLDWVVVGNDFATNVSTLAHEVGHYFNLLHTHEDRFGIELVDGSNCLTAGDLLCDTPADPNLNNCPGTCTDAACAYTGTFLQGGVPFTPLTDNVMCQARAECRINFTDDQIERMIQSYVDDNRNNLTGSCDDCIASRVFGSALVHQNDQFRDFEVNDFIESRARVERELPGEEGANVRYDAGNYVCLFPGFEAENTSNFLAIIDGCGGEFKTVKPITDKNSNFDLSIQPNPFSHQCSIGFDLFEDKVVTISISDIMGKKLVTLVNNELKVAGNQQFVFDGGNLPSGIYYCTIQAGNHIETQKMVLTK